MRISDWSSDVCSSDLVGKHAPDDADRAAFAHHEIEQPQHLVEQQQHGGDHQRSQQRHCDQAGDIAVNTRQALDFRVVSQFRRSLAQLWPQPSINVVLTGGVASPCQNQAALRSEEHTSELQSLMRISYAVFCLKKKNKT